MQFLEKFYDYLAKTTSIDKMYFELIFSTIIVLVLFSLIRRVGKFFISKKTTGRKEFIITQTFLIIINISIWSYTKY